MIGSKFLLDTNIISALLKGEKAIADKIDVAKDIYIPIIVLGELYYGAQYSIKIEANILSVNKLMLNYEILNANEQTASVYGNIKAALRRKGRPIPENDIWIASIAQQNNLILVTRDKHFSEIENLKTVSW